MYLRGGRPQEDRPTTGLGDSRSGRQLNNGNDSDPIHHHQAHRLHPGAGAPFLNLRAQHKNDRPNILWILGDDLGPQLGCYDYQLTSTPNADRIAREGVLHSLLHHCASLLGPAVPPAWNQREGQRQGQKPALRPRWLGDVDYSMHLQGVPNFDPIENVAWVVLGTRSLHMEARSQM
jgi:hypothetical protein